MYFIDFKSDCEYCFSYVDSLMFSVLEACSYRYPTCLTILYFQPQHIRLRWRLSNWHPLAKFTTPILSQTAWCWLFVCKCQCVCVRMCARVLVVNWLHQWVRSTSLSRHTHHTHGHPLPSLSISMVYTRHTPPPPSEKGQLVPPLPPKTGSTPLSWEGAGGVVVVRRNGKYRQHGKDVGWGGYGLGHGILCNGMSTQILPLNVVRVRKFKVPNLRKSTSLETVLFNNAPIVRSSWTFIQLICSNIQLYSCVLSMCSLKG